MECAIFHVQNLCSLPHKKFRLFCIFYKFRQSCPAEKASNRRCWTITNERLVQAGYYSILGRYESLHLCYRRVPKGTLV